MEDTTLVKIDILKSARTDLKECKKILKATSRETMGQIVNRLAAAELNKLKTEGK